ncbi:MAG: TlpA family protein disulfide reductase [Gammaproteobacteria bacterium]
MLPAVSCLRPLVLLLLLAAGTAAAQSSFGTRTLDGEPVRLSAYFEPGKWTLVMIWTTYCPVCAEQFPVVARLHRDNHARRLKVVAMAADGLGARAAVAAEMAARAPGFDTLVSDAAEIAVGLRETTGEPLGGTPTYLLYDPAGSLAARIDGPLEAAAIERYIEARE